MNMVEGSNKKKLSTETEGKKKPGNFKTGNGEHERFWNKLLWLHVKKNRADATARLQTHKPPHIITQHKDVIRPDKTSALISRLHVLQRDHGAVQH